MFKNAKPLAAPKPTKADKVTVPMKDLEKYAKICAAMDALAGVQAVLAAKLKDKAMDIFVEEGQKIHKRPENFRGTDGIASASIELRKRASTSPLSAEQVALFESLGLKPFKQVVTTEMYGINPVYAADSDMLAKVEGALSHLGLPEDFIVKQEEKSKMIVTDEMLDEVFKKDDMPREVIENVYVLAMKPKLEETNISEILREVNELVAPADDEVLTEQA